MEPRAHPQQALCGDAKELVENRRKVPFLRKWRLLYISLYENGPLWTSCLVMYYAASGLADWAYRHMHSMRQERNLPGLNSTAMNYEIWRHWNWESGGEEWTLSQEWKDWITREFLQHMRQGGDILEIGPGAGRWTDILKNVAGKLIAVDISDRCIEICKSKFSDYRHVEFYTNNGSDLSLIKDNSIDSVWSFDVFVHINAATVESYLKEMSRVMRAGGRAVIHHGGNKGARGGWRSDLDSELFGAMLGKHGFHLLAQISAVGAEKQFAIDPYGDVVSIIEKPGKFGQAALE